MVWTRIVGCGLSDSDVLLSCGLIVEKLWGLAIQTSLKIYLNNTAPNLNERREIEGRMKRKSAYQNQCVCGGHVK